VLRPRQQGKLARGAKDEEHAMPHKLNSGIAVIGIEIGKNSFHVVGHDKRGAIRNPKSGARLISQHSPSYPTRPYQPKTSNEAKEPLE
jgi:hypothetical protein